MPDRESHFRPRAAACIAGVLALALPTASGADHCKSQVDQKRQLVSSLQGDFKLSVNLQSTAAICDIGPRYIRAMNDLLAAVKRLPAHCIHGTTAPLEQLTAREKAAAREKLRRCTRKPAPAPKA